MISVENALREILSYVRPLGSQTVALTESLNRVLAQDLYCDADIPGFDNSAMDGYAVRSSDTKGASRATPVVLEVIGDIRAGYRSKKIVRTGHAIKTMTGAPIARGADAIVMVEDTKLTRPKSTPSTLLRTRLKNKQFIEVYKQLKKGENIRSRAEAISKGELVAKKGTLLEPAHIGILASLGKAKIKITRKPVVAILATGDELLDIGARMIPGKIRDSNTYALYCLILRCGGIPKKLGIAADDRRQLKEKLKKGLAYDVLIATGGVSVGEHDLVKEILAEMGTNTKIWRIAMRPGKPLAFSAIKNTLLFGLPGNPVSSIISFEIFVKPALLRMLGQNETDRKEVNAILQQDISKKKGLRYFLRARTYWQDGRYLTRTTGPQGSAILKSMASANSLIVLPEDQKFVKRKSIVKVMLLD